MPSAESTVPVVAEAMLPAKAGMSRTTPSAGAVPLSRRVTFLPSLVTVAPMRLPSAMGMLVAVAWPHMWGLDPVPLVAWVPGDQFVVPTVGMPSHQENGALRCW